MCWSARPDADIRPPGPRRHAETSCFVAYCEAVFSTRRFLIRVEQPVEMNDEIAHLRVVDRALRLGAPGDVGSRIVRVEADDLDVIEVLEGVVLEIEQLTTDDEMEQLLRGTIWHVFSSLRAARHSSDRQAQRTRSGQGTISQMRHNARMTIAPRC